jgi:sugar-specific transcriptional regulator TrmB
MYTQILTKLGLSENEAKMYELLLIKGESKASDLVGDSGLGRGNVYNLLTALVSMGLATVTAGKHQIYRAAEPTKLSTLLEAKRIETDRLAAEFKEELPKLTSTFNLTTGRPAIQVFEGYDGVEEVLNDSLSAPDAVLTYIDLSALTGEFSEINKRYLRRRIAKKVSKRIIAADLPEVRAFFAKQNTPFTEVAFAKDFPTGFKTAMEIYGNKVTYMTMTDERQISVMIEDAHIAAMHRLQFEYLWKMIGGTVTPPQPAAQPPLSAQTPTSVDSDSSDQQNNG